MPGTSKRIVCVLRHPWRGNDAGVAKSCRHDVAGSNRVRGSRVFLYLNEPIDIRPKDICELPVNLLAVLADEKELPPAPCEVETSLLLKRRMDVRESGKLQRTLRIAYAPVVSPRYRRVIFPLLNHRAARSLANGALNYRRYCLPAKTRHELQHKAGFRIKPDGKAFTFRGFFQRYGHCTLRVMQTPYILCVRSANSTCGTFLVG